MGARSITTLLADLRDGRREALPELLGVVYDQLHAIAQGQLRSQAQGRTLTPTVLVHEAYLRLFNQSRLDFNDRHHFFAVAAIAMRQIVVDYARRRLARKRGGDLARVPLDEVQLVSEDRCEEIVALDEQLLRLSEVDERLAKVVELRFFAGLSVEETAEVLEVTPRTVQRDWRKARLLLYDGLKGSGEA